MNNERMASMIAQGEGFDSAQREIIKRLMDSGISPTDLFREQAVKNNIATTQQLGYQDNQGYFNNYMVGRFMGSHEERANALRNPESAYEMLQTMTDPYGKPLFKLGEERMVTAREYLANMESPEKIKDLQNRLNINADGIVGKQTESALAAYMSVADAKNLAHPKKSPARHEQRVKSSYDQAYMFEGKKGSVKVYNYLKGDFGEGQDIVDHLVHREGVTYESYPDSLGKPTAGVGHLLTEEEQKKYPVGTAIPQSQVQKWLKQDTQTAVNAAKAQMTDMKVDDREFLVALTAVNFQLGKGWTEKFPTAWKHLKNKKYDKAIAEIQFVKEGSKKKSDWNKQTPERVKDFVSAINALK